MRKWFLFLFITGMFLGIREISGEQTSYPARNKKLKLSDFPDPLPRWQSDVVRWPFRFVGNLMLIEVKVDTVMGEFILDTGAPHLVLNTTYFRNYPRFGEVLAAGITGSAGVGSQTRVSRLELGDLYFEDVDADMVSLGHLETQRGTRILGLFGINLLARLELFVDFENGSLEFRKLNRQGDPIVSSTGVSDSTGLSIKLSGNSRLAIVSGEIAGKELRFCLDTGAESNVLHSLLSNKVMQQVKLLRTTLVSGSGSNSADALLGRISSLSVQEQPYPSLAATVMNLNNLREMYQDPIDGILGMDFLYRHSKMSLNMSKRKLTVWKRE